MNLPNGIHIAVWMMNNWMFHACGNAGDDAIIKNQVFWGTITAHVWEAMSRNGELVPL